MTSADFIISAFLSSGTSTDTVPVRIYSAGRTAPTPALNALATLTLVATLVIATILIVLWKLVAARQDSTRSGVKELATLADETPRALET